MKKIVEFLLLTVYLKKNSPIKLEKVLHVIYKNTKDLVFRVSWMIGTSNKFINQPQSSILHNKIFFVLTQHEL